MGERLARWAPWLLALLVLALTLPPCVGAQFLVDDVFLIARHQHPGDVLGEWTHPTHGFATGGEPGFTWRPLTGSLYHLWAAAFGREPLPFRLLNVLLHLANALLVATVARRLGVEKVVATGVAAAWAAHPLLADAVAWSADTCDLLATTLMLGSAAFALEGALPAALLLFTLAPFAKESALAFAALLPALVLHSRGWRAAAGLGLGALLVAVGHQALQRAVTGGLDSVGGVPPLVLLARLVDYSGWLVLPPVGAGLTHLPGEPRLLPGLALIAAGLLAAWRLPAARASALLGTLSWPLLLAPAALAAELLGSQPTRYTYGPSAVAFALGAGLAAALPPRLGLGLLGLWLALAGPASAGRLRRWADEETLLRAEAAAEPENPIAVGQLGKLLLSKGEIEGLERWRFAIKNSPPTDYMMDVQQERLDFAQAALALGRPKLAVEALDDFAALQAERGFGVDPSIEELRQRALRASSP